MTASLPYVRIESLNSKYPAEKSINFRFVFSRHPDITKLRQTRNISFQSSTTINVAMKNDFNNVDFEMIRLSVFQVTT